MVSPIFFWTNGVGVTGIPIERRCLPSVIIPKIDLQTVKTGGDIHGINGDAVPFNRYFKTFFKIVFESAEVAGKSG